MKNLTQLEKQVLEAVVDSDYQDGDVVNNHIWLLDENDVKMSKGQLSGAVSSCVKKGFVVVGTDEDGEGFIFITQLGFETLNS